MTRIILLFALFSFSSAVFAGVTASSDRSLVQNQRTNQSTSVSGVNLHSAELLSEAAQVSCSSDSEVDLRLCRMARLLESRMVSCQGNSCYSLFRSQVDVIQRVESLYLYEAIDYVSYDTGEQLRRTSLAICNYRVSLPGRHRQYLRRLAFHYNTFLEISFDLQNLAGVEFPEYCEIVVH